ncbi:MAG: DUF1015 domain-containing protein [Oscillospiraceae bacterium]
MNYIFKKANILIPKNSEDYPFFSTVACDQFTSQPDYWKNIDEYTKNKKSSYHITFPEIFLEDSGFEQRIEKINNNMNEYLNSNFFKEIKNSLIYVERQMSDNTIRQGVVGVIDLEFYDYKQGSQPQVRATEGTVLERIPPRVQIRKDAPLETPHIMLLIDDEEMQIIESLKENIKEKLYDFNLCANGGNIKGYLVEDTYADKFIEKINFLQDETFFKEKYPYAKNKSPLSFAAGDGNHSLATAKKCYEDLKLQIGESNAKSSPARYALCEIVNLHSDSLKFEAIHRVLFNCDYENLQKEMTCFYKNQSIEFNNHNDNSSKSFDLIMLNEKKHVCLKQPKFNLSVACLDEFLINYANKNNLKIDYIHGEEAVFSLCENGKNAGFILPAMEKSDLFKTVILDGALPRKTFSMGHANEKRYYLECRKIK